MAWSTGSSHLALYYSSLAHQAAQPRPPRGRPFLSLCLPQGGCLNHSILASALPIGLLDRAHQLNSAEPLRRTQSDFVHSVPSCFGHAHPPSRPRPSANFERGRGASPPLGFSLLSASQPPPPPHRLSCGQSVSRAGRASAPLSKPLGHAHLAQQVSSRFPGLPQKIDPPTRLSLREAAPPTLAYSALAPPTSGGAAPPSGRSAPPTPPASGGAAGPLARPSRGRLRLPRSFSQTEAP